MPTLPLLHALGARLRRLSRRTIPALALLLLVACDEDAVSIPEPVATVQVLAPSTSIVVGDSLELSAVARSAAGDPLPGRPIAWHSSDTTVAAVSPSGRVKARAAGTAEIRAVSGGRTGTATLTVRDPEPGPGPDPLPPTLSNISPAQAYAGGEGVLLFVVGERFTHASVVLWNGSARPTHRAGDREMQAFIPAEDLAVPGTVQVEVLNPDGRRSQALTFTVIANAPPQQKWLVIEPDPLVLLAGTTRQMTARWIDAGGSTVPGTPTPTYWSADTTIARVTPAGLVTAVRAGSVRIHAAGEGYATSSALEVRPVPSGPVQMYQAGPAGMSGMIVDSVSWDLGAPEPTKAALSVRAARITMDYETGRYVQEFQAYVTYDGQVVGTTGWMERGSWRYGWIEGNVVFAPDGGAAEFSGFSGGPGEIVVQQRVRNAPRHDRFVYVIRELPSF